MDDCELAQLILIFFRGGWMNKKFMFLYIVSTVTAVFIHMLYLSWTLILFTVYGFRLHHSGPFVRKVQQTRAMLVKHVLHSWRNLRMSVCQILSPVAFVIIACLIIDTMPVAIDPPALSLTLDPFPSVEVPFRAESGLEHLRNCYVNAVKEQVYLGFRFIEFVWTDKLIL